MDEDTYKVAKVTFCISATGTDIDVIRDIKQIVREGISFASGGYDIPETDIDVEIVGEM
jgi:hypothetical protein